MGLLIVDDVHRHYGGQEVLRGASFQIDPEEKVGLVGRNGGGKSTLLRLIEGLEAPDRGSITLRKGARMGHVPQSPTFAAGMSVRAYVSEGMAEARAAAAEAEALTERMGHAAGDELERLIHEHERATERARRLGAWEIERRVESVLSGIGLAPALWDREARTMSGGERGRAALARELVAGHDLLLLDEPTNHLDLAGIEWLESWLTTLSSAVLIVSHDRRLLDRAVGSILDLERGTLRRYPGNYAKYVALREERFQSEYRAWKNQADFIAKETDFIRRNMAGQRTTEAKGRLKKLENLVRLEEPTHEVRRPNIPAPKTARGGELVLEARELAAGYDGREVFAGLDLRIGRGQRVGIVGPNGAGKSTLLRVLAQRAQPARGTLEWGHKASVGYYDQDTSDLDVTSTPYHEIRRLEPAWSDQQIRSHLARFLFRGEEIEKSVSALSGGERARLSLARLLMREVTWLAMDEPTNHLDLAARTALEELLGAFDGALVCVSHDRAFLDGLCTRILCVEDGRVAIHEGSYTDYRNARLAEEAERAAAQAAAAKPRASEPRPEPRKEATASAAGKIRNPWAFEKLEARIIELEEELAKLHSALESEEVYRDPERLRETQTSIAETERELADCNERWENWA